MKNLWLNLCLFVDFEERIFRIFLISKLIRIYLRHDKLILTKDRRVGNEFILITLALKEWLIIIILIIIFGNFFFFLKLPLKYRVSTLILLLYLHILLNFKLLWLIIYILLPNFVFLLTCNVLLTYFLIFLDWFLEFIFETTANIVAFLWIIALYWNSNITVLQSRLRFFTFFFVF